MSIRAVLFDLDDTLLHHTRTSTLALEQVFTDYLREKRTTLERLLFLNESIYEALFPRLLSGELTQEQARALRFRQMLEECGQESSFEHGDETARAYYQHYDTLRTCLPGAPALLRALSVQVQVGILTNNPARAAADEALLEVTLEHWYCAGAGLHKPNPDFFRYALERLEVSPDEAVMVGDSWEKDVRGALAVGMRALWLSPEGVVSNHPEVPVLRGWEPLEAVLDLLLGKGHLSQTGCAEPATLEP